TISTAFASGWMRIRGARRRRALDRGFTLSDHVDWPSLLAAIDATGAQRVWVTHGYREPVVRWLRERGMEAEAVASRWEGELETQSSAAPGGEEVEEEAREEKSGAAAPPPADADADETGGGGE